MWCFVHTFPFPNRWQRQKLHDHEEFQAVCGAEPTLICRNPCVVCYPTVEVAESSSYVPAIFEAGRGQEMWMQLLVLTLFYSFLYDSKCELVKLAYLIEYAIKYVLLHLEVWKLKTVHFHLYLLSFSAIYLYSSCESSLYICDLDT